MEIRFEVSYFCCQRNDKDKLYMSLKAMKTIIILKQLARYFTNLMPYTDTDIMSRISCDRMYVFRWWGSEKCIKEDFFIENLDYHFLRVTLSKPRHIYVCSKSSHLLNSTNNNQHRSFSYFLLFPEIL